MMRRLVLAVALLVAAFAATPARAFDFNILAGFDYAGDFEADVGANLKPRTRLQPVPRESGKR